MLYGDKEEINYDTKLFSIELNMWAESFIVL